MESLPFPEISSGQSITASESNAASKQFVSSNKNGFGISNDDGNQMIPGNGSRHKNEDILLYHFRNEM
jgi:hypothetical protein